MSARRNKIESRVAVFAMWVFGLALETVIQVYVTGVRPHADQRPLQVLAMMCVFGAVVLVVRRRDEDFRWTVSGAFVGACIVVAFALAGESSPPKAGLLMLVTTWSGLVWDQRWGRAA